ncbi:MAG: tRNA pseudouridine(55) synthase TruB [Peptococcaceae bacterium]|nr:tRNA pseudouridine(55) synthase TruB [Peptococcaceae bacterium]
MNGVINVNKGAGMTSADVVYRLRKLLRMKKIGHMGTLDPEAQGVLPVGVGQATRLTEYYSVQGKTYRATLTLGVVTDTQDGAGRVLETRRANVSREELEGVLPRFTGDLMQVPPMYSAVHHKGRRLYELARSGVTVEREARPVQVEVLRLLEWQGGEQPRASLEVACSKGTYIRTLCHDIGAHLGCGGHMSELWRIRVGCWRLEEAWTLEEIARCVDAGEYGFLQEMGYGLPLPKVEIPVSRRRAFAHGLATQCPAFQYDYDGRCGHTADRCLDGGGNQGTHVQVYCQGAWMGIGRWQRGCLYPVKVMVSAEGM